MIDVTVQFKLGANRKTSNEVYRSRSDASCLRQTHGAAPCKHILASIVVKCAHGHSVLSLNEMIRNIPLPFRHCKVWPSGSRGLLGRLVLWLVVASLIPALYGILTHAHLPSFLCMYAVESSDVMRVEQANPPKSFNHLSL